MAPYTRGTQSAAAGILWCFAGLLAGSLLGVSLALPPRVIVFFAAVGLAIGWFGFTGTYRRINGHGHQLLLPAPEFSSQRVEVQEKRPAPFRVEDHIFSREEVRQWLDDFLVQQQRK